MGIVFRHSESVLYIRRAAVEDTAHQHFSVLLCNSDENSEKETMYVELMVAEHVAGVILSPTRPE